MDTQVKIAEVKALARRIYGELRQLEKDLRYKRNDIAQSHTGTMSYATELLSDRIAELQAAMKS